MSKEDETLFDLGRSHKDHTKKSADDFLEILKKQQESIEFLKEVIEKKEESKEDKETKSLTVEGISIGKLARILGPTGAVSVVITILWKLYLAPLVKEAILEANTPIIKKLEQHDERFDKIDKNQSALEYNQKILDFKLRSKGTSKYLKARDGLDD